MWPLEGPLWSQLHAQLYALARVGGEVGLDRAPREALMEAYMHGRANERRESIPRPRRSN